MNVLCIIVLSVALVIEVVIAVLMYASMMVIYNRLKMVDIKLDEAVDDLNDYMVALIKETKQK